MRIMLVFLIAFSFFSQGQIVSKNTVGFQSGMNRLDFYTGLRYQRAFKQFYPELFFDCAVNRSFFQQRFSPRFGLGVCYDVCKNKKCVFGPVIHYSTMTLRVNKSTSHFDQFHDFNAGLSFMSGGRFHFFSSLTAGLLNERYYNQLTQKKTGVNMVNFNLLVGIGYAF